MPQAGGGALSDRLYVDKAHLGDHGHIYAVFVLTQVRTEKCLFSDDKPSRNYFRCGRL